MRFLEVRDEIFQLGSTVPFREVADESVQAQHRESSFLTRETNMLFQRLFGGRKQNKLTRTVDFDALSAMREAGFQPFIMVRLDEGAQGRSYLVCPTQNEAPQFVHDLVAKGVTAKHPLLFAIDKALRQEAEAAAEALNVWITENDSHYAVTVLHGISAFDRSWSPFYVGYPVLNVNLLTRTRNLPDKRFDALWEFATSYSETNGNDSLRTAIVEAFVLGAAVSARKIGREKEALTLAHRARELRRESIALETAVRALTPSIDGESLPS